VEVSWLKYKIKPREMGITSMSKKYETPPIIEALCHFQYRQNTSWDLTIPGFIYEKVKNTFPQKTQVAHMDLAAVTRLELANPRIGHPNPI
jgi:uncharacterized protein (TIGR04255 family)